jgi:hypothetical protein
MLQRFGLKALVRQLLKWPCHHFHSIQRPKDIPFPYSLVCGQESGVKHRPPPRRKSPHTLLAAVRPRPVRMVHPRKLTFWHHHRPIWGPAGKPSSLPCYRDNYRDTGSERGILKRQRIGNQPSRRGGMADTGDLKFGNHGFKWRAYECSSLRLTHCIRDHSDEFHRPRNVVAGGGDRGGECSTTCSTGFWPPSDIQATRAYRPSSSR